VRTVCNQAFNNATVEGKILSNPIAAVKAPAARATEIETVPPDVVMACIAEARKHWDRTIAMAIHLAAATGARRAELCGLQWADLRGSTLHIERAVNVLEGGGFEVVRPKTSMSRRSIALDGPVLAALSEFRQWQTMYRWDQFKGDPHVWVLGDLLTDDPRLPDRLTHEWIEVRDEVPGAKHVRLHDLRHWNATSMLDAGIPIPTVAGRLGHASGATTIRIYSHRTRRADEASADAIGKLFGA
jgi:integrase